MVSIAHGANLICGALKNPCLIARNGSTELQVLSFFETTGTMPQELCDALQQYSGIFPATEKSVREWIAAYYSALNCIEEDPVVAGWFPVRVKSEERLLAENAPLSTHIPLRSLEPYYVKAGARWTALLKKKRVAVVTSFAKSVAKQLASDRKAIWGAEAESLLPSSAEWFPIQTGFPSSIAQGRCEWPAGIDTWQDAVKYLVDEVLKVKADVCLIGCGAIGVIVGAELKKKGVRCVVLGGAIQVLFGIKGARWAKHDVISKFWTPAWVWPDKEETPIGASDVENGCYWSNQPRKQVQWS